MTNCALEFLMCVHRLIIYVQKLNHTVKILTYVHDKDVSKIPQ